MEPEFLTLRAPGRESTVRHFRGYALKPVTHACSGEISVGGMPNALLLCASNLGESSDGTMADAPKKIVVLGQPGVDAAELARLLGDRFDVVVSAPKSTGLDDPWAAALLDLIADGAALVSPSGQALWSNASFAALDAATRDRISDLCRDGAKVLGAPGAGSAIQRRVHRVDVQSADLSRSYEVTVTAAPDRRAGTREGAASAGHLAVVVRDATERHRYKQKLEAIERAGSELMRLDAETIRRMNSVERLKLMEAKIVGYARDLLHFDHFGVRLLDERSGKLELVISSGLPASYAEIDIYPLPEGNGISGHVAATGKSYLCDDAATDALFLPGLTGAKSSLTVALKLHEKVIGILNAESQQPHAFTQEDRQFAELFARSIAMALHILDLLVVERSTTNQSVSGRVEGEVSGPLQDILHEVDFLVRSAPGDAETQSHIARIRADVESIRARVKEVALGPTTLLGVEKALADKTQDPAMAGKRVLVADDEAKIRRIIGDVLRNRGCDVVVCDSGVSAIEALTHADNPFHLVVSDIRMPDRNGYEVFSAARRHQGDVPVILMTGFGYDPHHSIVRASQEGLAAVLFKPFPVERLVDEVRKAVTTKHP